MQALTTTCALIASAALTLAVFAAPALNNTPIPTQAASYAALDQAIGDYRLDASLDAEKLAAGAIVTLMRTGGGYALALPGAPGEFARMPVELAVEADAAGAPVLVLTHNDRSVRAHRTDAAAAGALL